jgi:hypothetical protein
LPLNSEKILWSTKVLKVLEIIIFENQDGLCFL